MFGTLFRRRTTHKHDRLARMETQLARVDRLVTRLQRDTEQMKLHTSTVLGPTRAIALLATGQRIYVDPRDRGVAISLLTEGKHEEDELAVFRRYLRPGAVVLDIGANYGIYAINVAPYVQPGGRVIGFEPNPHICELFNASIWLNGLTHVVEARQLGVHDSNGSLPFLIDETGPGGARVVAPDWAPAPGSEIVSVPVVRLDDHLPPDLVVDAVKIDVEGHEEAVLRGMRRLIERSPDIVIIMELFHAFFPDDATFARFLSFVTDELGLFVSRIEPNAALTPVSTEMLRGTTGSLLLSKRAPVPRPELTIVPQQIHIANGAERVAGEVRWERSSAPLHGPVAHGPYLYLPKGSYRLKIDGDFEGSFACMLQENYGDPIARLRIPAGHGFETMVNVPFDAPMFELALTPAMAGGPASLSLRKIELWKAG